jgi:uncharacterized membrane protein
MLSLVFLSIVSGPIQGTKPVEVIDLGVIKGWPYMVPTDISDKGDVATGWASWRDPESKEYKSIAWVWTLEGGMTLLSGRKDIYLSGALTGDGKFFAGPAHNPPSGPYVYLGLSSRPNSITYIGDGLIHGGRSDGWNTGLRFSGNGQYLLGTSIQKMNTLQLHNMKDGSNLLLPKPGDGSCGIGGISRDGSRVLISGQQTAHLWDRSRPDVTKQIRILGNNGHLEINCLSDDGKYVAGYGSFPNKKTAFRWSEEKGIEFAPLNINESPFHASVINGDGGVVAGMDLNDGWVQPTIWTDKLGRRSLKSLLRPGEMENPKVIFDKITDMNPAGTTFLVRGFLLKENVPTYRIYIVKFASRQVMESR